MGHTVSQANKTNIITYHDKIHSYIDSLSQQPAPEPCFQSEMKKRPLPVQIQSKEKLHASQVLSPRDYASPAKKLEPALIEPLTSEIKRKKSEDFDCDMIEEDPNNLCNYIYSTILPENSKSPQDNPPISTLLATIKKSLIVAEMTGSSESVVRFEPSLVGGTPEQSPFLINKAYSDRSNHSRIMRSDHKKEAIYEVQDHITISLAKVFEERTDASSNQLSDRILDTKSSCNEADKKTAGLRTEESVGKDAAKKLAKTRTAFPTRKNNHYKEMPFLVVYGLNNGATRVLKSAGGTRQNSIVGHRVPSKDLKEGKKAKRDDTKRLSLNCGSTKDLANSEKMKELATLTGRYNQSNGFGTKKAVRANITHKTETQKTGFQRPSRVSEAKPMQSEYDLTSWKKEVNKRYSLQMKSLEKESKRVSQERPKKELAFTGVSIPNFGVSEAQVQGDPSSLTKLLNQAHTPNQLSFSQLMRNEKALFNRMNFATSTKAKETIKTNESEKKTFSTLRKSTNNEECMISNPRLNVAKQSLHNLNKIKKISQNLAAKNTTPRESKNHKNSATTFTNATDVTNAMIQDDSRKSQRYTCLTTKSTTYSTNETEPSVRDERNSTQGPMKTKRKSEGWNQQTVMPKPNTMSATSSITIPKGLFSRKQSQVATITLENTPTNSKIQRPHPSPEHKNQQSNSDEAKKGKHFHFETQTEENRVTVSFCKPFSRHSCNSSLHYIHNVSSLNELEEALPTTKNCKSSANVSLNEISATPRSSSNQTRRMNTSLYGIHSVNLHVDCMKNPAQTQGNSNIDQNGQVRSCSPELCLLSDRQSISLKAVSVPCNSKQKDSSTSARRAMRNTLVQDVSFQNPAN